MGGRGTCYIFSCSIIIALCLLNKMVLPRGKGIYMPVNLKQIKNSHIPDLFFYLGVMTIVYMLLF